MNISTDSVHLASGLSCEKAWDKDDN